ncbi:MAG: hypothetical protein WCF84_03830 [Anaerolineae bacterium]
MTILYGLGLGTVLIASVLTGLDPEAQGGVFTLCMGLGFMSISPLAWFSAGRKEWWALIVGGVSGLLGIGLLVGGPALEVVKFAGNFWPLILVAIGLSILFKARKQTPER